MSNYTVSITQSADKFDTKVESEVLGPDVDLNVITARDPVEIGLQAKDSDAVLVWRTPIAKEAIDQMSKCKVIVRIGIGYDIVDIHAARDRGIPVCNVPDYGTNDVADHTLALMLNLRRGIGNFNDAVREGNSGWDYTVAGNLSRLTDQTLGIIGLGRIGTAVALRAKAFGMKVAFYDPYCSPGQEKAIGVVRKATVEDLLKDSDVVSIHTPLTDETRNFASHKFFSAIKHGAILINTARGGIVDIDALEIAMREGKISGAGLDVWPTEPPNPVTSLMQEWRDNADWIKGRLIATPHSAFYNAESYHEMRSKAAQTVRDVLDGYPARNCVNL